MISYIQKCFSFSHYALTFSPEVVSLDGYQQPLSVLTLHHNTLLLAGQQGWPASTHSLVAASSTPPSCSKSNKRLSLLPLQSLHCIFLSLSMRPTAVTSFQTDWTGKPLHLTSTRYSHVCQVVIPGGGLFLCWCFLVLSCSEMSVTMASTFSLHHLYLTWAREVLHHIRKCPIVPLRPQSLHIGSSLFTHLCKFAGMGGCHRQYSVGRRSRIAQASKGQPMSPSSSGYPILSRLS